MCICRLMLHCYNRSLTAFMAFDGIQMFIPFFFFLLDCNSCLFEYVSLFENVKITTLRTYVDLRRDSFSITPKKKKKRKKKFTETEHRTNEKENKQINCDI